MEIRQWKKSSFTIEHFRDIVKRACNFELDRECIPTFLLRRLDVNEVLEAAMEPATPAVETRLKEILQELQWDDRISLYQYLTAISVAKAISWLRVRVISTVNTLARRNSHATVVPMVQRSLPVECEKRIHRNRHQIVLTDQTDPWRLHPSPSTFRPTMWLNWRPDWRQLWHAKSSQTGCTY